MNRFLPLSPLRDGVRTLTMESICLSLNRRCSGIKLGDSAALFLNIEDVIEPQAINLAAAISAKDSGDARLALKMLSNAGELAEEKGEKKITIEDVRDASKNAEEEIAYELVSTLPEHQRLIVYAIAMLTIQGSRYKKLVQGEDTYLFSGEVYDKYVAIINSLKKDPKSSRWYRKYITDLEMQGLVATYESGKGIRGHTKLIKLLYPPAKIRNTIEKGLFNESEAEVKTT